MGIIINWFRNLPTLYKIILFFIISLIADTLLGIQGLFFIFLIIGAGVKIARRNTTFKDPKKRTYDTQYEDTGNSMTTKQESGSSLRGPIIIGAISIVLALFILLMVA